MNVIEKLLCRIRGEATTEKLISMGMKVGEEYTVHKNVSMEKRMEQKAALEGKIGYID